MKVYISGKISGLTENEFTKNFDFATYHIEADYQPDEIVNPIDIKPLFGIKKWIFFMIADIWKLRKCTHIAMQKNWIDSKGACIEHFLAKFIFKHEIIYL